MSRVPKLWAIILALLLMVWAIAGVLGGALAPALLARHQIGMWAIGYLLILLQLKLSGSGSLATLLLALSSVWWTAEMVIWMVEGKPSERIWIAFSLFYGTALWEYIKVHGKKK